MRLTVLTVMAGLVPAISMEVAQCPPVEIAGTSPAMTTLSVGLGLLIGMRERAVVLDQIGAFIDEEFVLAIGAQQLDAGVAQVLVMDVEFLVAFGAAGIEMLDHVRLLAGVACCR
jgi:hypothetical protein